ncbi:hypothetical protein [Hyalangium sp.]|uniref:hypothetical protein n=1 Tax=Hyalangium sp. TaxID=2028555 RepID=UPI002D6EC55D|nr:hypothetical protein [Hyalangium sp.]HYI03000.1 hypothetical protein [Hyalangium sp.]
MSRMTLILALLLTFQAQAEPPTEQEVNASSLLTGARVVDEGGTPQDMAAGMFDGSPCTQYDLTLSQNLPLILELVEPFDLTRLEVINSNNEEYTPGISVRTLRIEQGQSPSGPWRARIDWELQKGSEPQTRPVSMERTRYLRVTLVANHGNKDWIGLGELRMWGRRSAAREILFTGAWETAYGELRLSQVGQKITGCYGPPDSQAGDKLIEGTLRDTVFIGTWRENRTGGPDTVGPVAFALTQEGNLSGIWGYTPSERTRRWDGKRLAKPTISCKKPKRTPGQETPAEGPQGATRTPPPPGK